MNWIHQPLRFFGLPENMQGERYHNQDNLNSGVKNRRNYCMPLLYTAYQGTAFMFPSWWCSCPGASAWDGGGHRSSWLQHRRGPGCWKLGAEAHRSSPEILVNHRTVLFVTTIFVGVCWAYLFTSEPLGQKIRGRVLDIQETWCGGLAWELGHVFVSLRHSSETWNWIFLQNMAGNRVTHHTSFYPQLHGRPFKFQIQSGFCFVVLCGVPASTSLKQT